MPLTFASSTSFWHTFGHSFARFGCLLHHVDACKVTLEKTKSLNYFCSKAAKATPSRRHLSSCSACSQRTLHGGVQRSSLHKSCTIAVVIYISICFNVILSNFKRRATQEVKSRAISQRIHFLMHFSSRWLFSRQTSCTLGRRRKLVKQNH